jgi:hypothetical protein
VQQQDKVVDDLAAAHLESQLREDVAERGDEALPIAIHEAIAGAALEIQNRLLGAVRLVLEGGSLSIHGLGLPALETRALEALEIAVSGKSALGDFVYAEDRRDLLERALTVLQPDLSRTADGLAQAQLADLSVRVADLRNALTSLVDSQDEIVETSHEAAEVKAAPGDPPAPTPADPDALRPASMLAGPGPEAPGPDRRPTSLAGPEVAEPAPPPSTLTGPGPEAPGPARPPTSLTGAELVEPAPPPTTLVGPEVAAEVKPPSSLGDPEELAEQARRPWWRRPFG